MTLARRASRAHARRRASLIGCERSACYPLIFTLLPSSSLAGSFLETPIRGQYTPSLADNMMPIGDSTLPPRAPATRLRLSRLSWSEKQKRLRHCTLAGRGSRAYLSGAYTSAAFRHLLPDDANIISLPRIPAEFRA